MKNILAPLMMALALANPVHAQETQNSDTESLKYPIMAFVAGATMDNVSTAWALTHENNGWKMRESNPLLGWAHDSPVKIAVAASLTDLATVMIARHYSHEHPKLVKSLLYATGAIRFSFGTSNVMPLNHAATIAVPAGITCSINGASIPCH